MMGYTVNYNDKSVTIFESTKDISKAIYNLVAEELHRAQDENRALHICLSGGSTPLKIFGHLRLMPLNMKNFSSLHVYWGDERCVGPDHEESNAGNAGRAILDYINIPENNIHRMKGEEDPEEESKRYEELLRTKLPVINGRPSFDITFLGMGEDGHTASLFPGQDHLIQSTRLVCPSVNPGNGQQRITLTPAIINNSRIILFLITGEAKAKLLSRILKREYDYLSYPVSSIKAEGGRMVFFLDQEAGKYLRERDMK
jgi:6-phosphogluconolactonase